LADKLQECVLDIYCNLIDANSFKGDTLQHKNARYDLQTKAITHCNKFLSLTKYSLHANLISFSTSERWIGLAHDIKFMSLRWRKI
jgi:hypothetical protein